MSTATCGSPGPIRRSDLHSHDEQRRQVGAGDPRARHGIRRYSSGIAAVSRRSRAAASPASAALVGRVAAQQPAVDRLAPSKSPRSTSSAASRRLDLRGRRSDRRRARATAARVSPRLLRRSARASRTPAPPPAPPRARRGTPIRRGASRRPPSAACARAMRRSVTCELERSPRACGRPRRRGRARLRARVEAERRLQVVPRRPRSSPRRRAPGNVGRRAAEHAQRRPRRPPRLARRAAARRPGPSRRTAAVRRAGAAAASRRSALAASPASTSLQAARSAFASRVASSPAAGVGKT